jgi:uncharacterized protein (TIGR03118 family)
MSRASIRSLRWLAALLAALGAVVALAPAGGAARSRPNRYVQRNLISDIPGVARSTDPNLVNPWGMAAGPSTPLWVADNHSDVSTIYSGARDDHPAQIVPLVVHIPGGAPTGLVFNGGTGFVVHAGSASAPARFIFDSESGHLTAWSPQVPPMTQAQTVATEAGAVFKGLAIAANRLYAADFHGGKIDVFDSTFAPTTLAGHFTDPNLPAGYAPFGIQAIGGRLYVTYAKQDADKMDDTPGPGNGFVDVYDTNGHLLRRLVSHGRLNSPWGLALAPGGFGRFSHDLLVGNFGDGQISAYDARTGHFDGQLRNGDGERIRIDGLWALRFGNRITGGTHRLLFTAGIADEDHGLFGTIAAR